MIWSDVNSDEVELITSDGEVVKRKTRRASDEARIFRRMSEPRRPMKVNVRPGRGGHQRSAPVLELHDGIDEFGSWTWWAVPGGARIGVVELDNTGNAAICCRLSSDDRNERFTQQIEPNLALAARYCDELRPRYILLAENMSGTREVRPDRAGPPSDGTLERDDILVLDKWMGEGWLEHVIWRDVDRYARVALSAEVLLARWQKNRIGLWLASYGRQMDYTKDGLTLRALSMVATEERNALTRRMQTARINKTILAGRGWASLPYGFYRDPATGWPKQDLEQAQWILKAFEYAASGVYRKGAGLSTRRLAQRLEEEGCPFDHDRLRTILQNPVYVTGEWTNQLRGIPVAQRPMELELPVPMTLFVAVQNLLSLRQGSTKNTPLGEFLFNYVETVHTQCADERRERKLPRGLKREDLMDPDAFIDPARIRGHVYPTSPRLRRLHHSPFCPEQCKSGGRGHRGAFTWDRELLEPPVVEAVRELAEHPAVLEQAAIAARHTASTASSKLTPAQRRELERRIEQLRSEQEAAADAQVDGVVEGKSIDWDEFGAVNRRLLQKIREIELQLAADDAATDVDAHPDRYGDRVRAFLEVMTVETPADDFHRALRARLFQRIVSSIEIDDSGAGEITLTLYGHLVPTETPLDAANPVLAAADLLDAWEDVKAGKTPRADAEWERTFGHLETDLSSSKNKSVWDSYGDLLDTPGQTTKRAMKHQRITHNGWHKRNGHSRRAGVPSWSVSRFLPG